MRSNSFIDKIIHNPIIQTLVIFISGGWIILEITEYFIGNFGLNENARNILVIILLFVLPVALFLTWYINRKGTAPVEEDNLKQTVKSQTPAKRRTLFTNPWFTIPGIILFILMGLAVTRTIHHKIKVKQARTEWLPEAGKLALLKKAEKYIPDDPEFIKLEEILVTRITILSDPAGAEVHIKNYSEVDAAWGLLGPTPIDAMEMPAQSFYRFLMVKPGYDTVEAVLSTISDTLHVRLHKKGTIPEDMVYVPGFGEESGSDFKAEKHAFYIDKYEVTNKQFKVFKDSQGYQRPEYWEHEFINNGERYSRESAMGLFVDKSGRPGPSTWIAGDFPDGQANYPVNGISWFEAAAYAKFIGKELPTNKHWESAAGFDYWEFWYGFGHKLIPLSNFKNEGPEPVGLNRGLTLYGTLDLAGNVREWCWNKTAAGRLIRGGAWNDVSYMFGNEGQLSVFDRSAKNGFRCVLYGDREKIPQEAFDPLELVTARNYTEEKPVNDDIFAIYRQQFAYDELVLNSNLELRDDSPEEWVMEKFSFDAAYENERMIAYLFLPKNAKPPYQTMIFFPGSYAVSNNPFPDRWFFSFCEFLVKNGIAVVMPIYKSTYERRGEMPNKNHMPNESHLYTAYLIKWLKDFSRTIDYMETRTDFDMDKIGLYTHSWGGLIGAYILVIGAYILAVEERVSLCVHVLGGFDYFGKGLPEADIFNYLPRNKVPVLMLNGKYDMRFPLESEVIPYFDLLGTPAEDKELKVYESDHWIPKTEMIRETLNWLEKYFGPVIK